jgi:transcription-repair coupling factor (superfamily II helicase)
LKRTVQSLQGKIPSILVETKLEIPVDARLPESYVNDIALRMEFYQRLGDAIAPDAVDAIFDEMKDRFGEPPLSALWLLHLTRVKSLASRKGYTLLKVENRSLYTERKSGKTVATNRQFFSLPKDPKKFEETLSALL